MQAVQAARPAPSLPPLGLVCACYALCVSLAMSPWAGNDAGRAMLATLPPRLQEVPFALHCSTLVHAAVSRAAHRTGPGAVHATLLCFIGGVSTVTHALLAFAVVPARVSAYGTLTVPLRLITWCFSTPAMLLMLVQLAGERTAVAWATTAAQEALLLAGLAALVLPGPSAHVFNALSFAIFTPLLLKMHAMFRASVARASAGSMRARALRLCHAVTIILWSSYPGALLLAICGLLSPASAEMTWGIVDALTKSTFAATLLHANMLTNDEAAVQSIRAVTDAKSRQLAALCHEIRNPLNGIMCNLQELDAHHGAVPPVGGSTVGPAADAQGLVTKTLTCAAQLRRTLDDFLDLSKAEYSQLRVCPAPVQLRVLLVSVASQVLRAARDKGLCMHVLFEPPSLGAHTFVIDAGRVAQASGFPAVAPIHTLTHLPPPSNRAGACQFHVEQLQVHVRRVHHARSPPRHRPPLRRRRRRAQGRRQGRCRRLRAGRQRRWRG